LPELVLEALGDNRDIELGGFGGRASAEQSCDDDQNCDHFEKLARHKLSPLYEMIIDS
jgi:hypothetical protein